MSVSAARGLANVNYAVLYLPPLALVVLWGGDIKPSHYTFGIFNDPRIFSGVLAATTIGALANHAVNLSIFGIDGPSRNPKHRFVYRFYIWALLFTSRPNDPWDSIEDAFDRVFEFLRKKMSDSASFLRFFVRSTVFGVCGIIYSAVTYLSIVWLFEVTIFGAGPVTSMILLLAITGFKLRGLVFSQFPTPTSAESAKWVNTPEFRRAEKLHEEGEVKLRDERPGIIEDVEEIVRNIKEDYPTAEGPLSDIDEEDFLISLEQDRKYLIELEDDEE
jgi:hypothetical protein